jgi:hypothetical protein
MDTRPFLSNELNSQNQAQRAKPEKGEENGWPNSYHPEPDAAQTEK